MKVSIDDFVFCLVLVLAPPPVLADPKTITLPRETAQFSESAHPGYALAKQKCLICHSADYIHFQPPGLTLEQWQGEVEKMRHSYGAQLSDDEAIRIAAYLAVTYGSAKMTDADVIAATGQPGQTNPSAGVSEAAQPSEILNENGCLGCHSLDQPVVGPAFREIAKKYKKIDDADKQLAESIKQGSTGKWGQMPMPPMTGLGDSQIKIVVEYILNL